MDYALIENGVVTNLIWLHYSNAHEFPNAVPLAGVPAGIGDTFLDGVFYRDGERVLSRTEHLENILDNLIGGINDVQSR